MSKQEGVASLWRGSGLTVNRAMIVTASQLASYDQAKEMILEKGLMSDEIGTHVAASFLAGFVASVASNPIDVIKTRVMNMKVDNLFSVSLFIIKTKIKLKFFFYLFHIKYFTRKLIGIKYFIVNLQT
jgi:hypothetical protein